MSTLIWRGDAQGRAQVTHVTPANVETGDIFTLTVNRKDVSFAATAPTVANVVNGLVAAWNAAADAEFDEATASVGTTSGAITHVVLTGPANGKPFTVTASTTNAGSFGVLVTTLADGVPSTNEQQRITLAGPPTGGTFTLTFDGQTTAAIAYNASAATVQTRLEALSNIAPGDVVVTGNSGGPWTVEFESTYAGVNVPLITGNGASLTGAGSVSVVTTTEGESGTNEVQRIQYNGQIPVNWRVNFNGVTSSYIAPDSSAAVVQAALEAMSTIGSGNVSVVKTFSIVDAFHWYDVTFINVRGNHDQPEMTQVVGPVEISTLTEGSGDDVNEVQTVTVNGSPTGGTFTLTFSGATTAGIAYNAAASAVKSALEALATIGAGNIDVSGSAGGPYTCTFQGTLAHTDVSQMTGSGASLTGGAVYTATTQEATSGSNESQQVELTGGPTGGTFTMTFGANTTAGIAYNASAATLQTALEGLASIGAGNIGVVGLAGGPWTCTFQGSLAKTNVAALTGSGAGLTGVGTQTLTVSQAVAPTGPNWWNEPENWSTGSNPANGDDVWFELSDVDCLYGIDQLSTVTLASLHMAQSYSGKIGLPVYTGLYYEYRPTYLAVGASSVLVGEGEGSGSGRIKLDTGSVQTNLVLIDGGTPEDGSLPAVLWKGSHASNAARVFKGSLGAAVLAGETATLSVLQVGTRGDVEGDAEVFGGPGLSLTTVDKSGGLLELSAAATTITQTAGELVFGGSGGVTNLAIRGGTCFYNSTGTLGGNPIVSGDGLLDFSQDLRAKTVTNPIEVHGDTARIRDPYKVVSSLVIDGNEIEGNLGQFELGPNIRITREVPA